MAATVVRVVVREGEVRLHHLRVLAEHLHRRCDDRRLNAPASGRQAQRRYGVLVLAATWSGPPEVATTVSSDPCGEESSDDGVRIGKLFEVVEDQQQATVCDLLQHALRRRGPP